ncbi:MAG: pyruvate, phosphate dikinase [Gammaproteobacteria bacterium]|nr:pyruvate, phosphate dikinase [Gammaproteobacteria bacterium]
MLERDRLFGTKAETLARLVDISDAFTIPAFKYFDVSRWRSEADAILDDLNDVFASAPAVAVRSSAAHEDGATASMAGHFDSVLGVPAHHRDQLRAAIEQVIASFDGDDADQIMVQRQATHIELSGIAMTHDIRDGSPYIVINYDDTTGRTDSVTSGAGIHKTILLHRGIALGQLRSPRMRAILKMVREIESYFGREPLDIEFAVDRDGSAHLFQVRRIASRSAWDTDVEVSVDRRLPALASFIADVSARRDGIFGDTTVLGNMSDWNPVEMIGAIPRPLAASLYRDLITRSVWQTARARLGYRRMPPQELMVFLDARPFIDIRASFNSFLPEGLDATVAERLVNAELARLRASPELHDKIEFEIVPSVRDFTLEPRLKDLYGEQLSADARKHLTRCLEALTCALVDIGPDASLARAEARVAAHHESQKRRQPPEANAHAELYRVGQLLIETRRAGTLPFAMLARHSFIAETLLRTAIARGAICVERVAEFKLDIDTVATQMADALAQVSAGQLDARHFLKEYGHLRPGTYDILSPRYDARAALFDSATALSVRTERRPFELHQDERRDLGKLLAESAMTKVDADGFMAYARRATVAREFGKFVFTRDLSDAIESLARFGKQIGVTREQLSFLSVDELLNGLVQGSSNFGPARLQERATEAEAAWRGASVVKLSYLIMRPDDLYAVIFHRSIANFVGNARVDAPWVHVSNQDVDGTRLTGRVVCIENADPGYDWIFLKGISGLVTKYGGANSHMAIRCAEFGLPAAIGCGEQLFNDAMAGNRIELDCASQTLRAID